MTAEHHEFWFVVRVGAVGMAAVTAVLSCLLSAIVGKIVVFGSDGVGRGNDELGRLLMGAFLYVLM